MKYIHKYVRGRKNNLIGVVLATVVDGGVQIGWSACGKNDIFDKEFGVRVALQRAITKSKVPAPPKIAREFPEIMNRGVRYFKVNPLIGVCAPVISLTP